MAGRRRWIQRVNPETGKSELVEVDLNHRARTRNCSDFDALISERHYDGMRATDGTDISSRAKHREYMRRNNFTTADDFRESWKNAPQERDKNSRAIRREAVERAIHHLEGPP